MNQFGIFQMLLPSHTLSRNVLIATLTNTEKQAKSVLIIRKGQYL